MSVSHALIVRPNDVLSLTRAAHSALELQDAATLEANGYRRVQLTANVAMVSCINPPPTAGRNRIASQISATYGGPRQIRGAAIFYAANTAVSEGLVALASEFTRRPVLDRCAS